MRLILVPQYPSKLRYQEWWFDELPKRLIGFDEIVVLGEEFYYKGEKADKYMFSPISLAIEFEIFQIQQYKSMKIYNDDIMLICDLSFPGLFGNILHHKRPQKIFSFCHATSLNNLDYFEPVRYSKKYAEKSIAEISEKVFVGSYYHKRKLEENGITNTIVSYLPHPPFKRPKLQIPTNRSFKIASVSRPTPQKVDIEKERMIERQFDTKIVRRECTSWGEYYWFLSNTKILFISAQEETFGYQVVDAVLNGCIPIAPRKFSYPELLDDDYLYEDDEDMIEAVKDALNGIVCPPKSLKCHKDMDIFYHILVNTMKG